MKNKFLNIVLSAMVLLTTAVVPSQYVKAEDNNDTLTVDCGSILRNVTHCASGSLYGVTENKPSKGNISSLIEPLNPNVFTNPAAAGEGYQQMMGAAIPVAERLDKKTTGRVMIRLADLFPGWPYKWTSLDDWKSKVTEVINKKKDSKADNFYGYEIWNEPCFTWNEKTNNLEFYKLWKETYDLIRNLDPDADIVGPSEGYYDHDKMKDFLDFCKDNNCMPDIITWHELTANGVDVSGCADNLKDCREIASGLGVDDVKISINEYCDTDHSKEGQPAASASYIAKFERYKVDSACISWWWTQVPGRLGSLLAADNKKGAGWWFYKWYGDMSGDMVNVTPPDENSRRVDGFACVDSSKKYVSVLLGGDNDGTIDVNVKNIPDFIGENANVTVEKVDWKSKDTPVNGTNVVNADNYSVSDGKLHISIPDTNNSSGYRVYIKPAEKISDKDAVKFAEKSLAETIPSETQKDLSLPTEGAYGTKISWQSSNTDVIDNTGRVTCQSNEEKVKLTASISKGESVKSKKFTITVKPFTKVRYEAESADISNGIVFNNQNSSNGAYVGKLDYNDPQNNKYSYIDFNVDVPSDGEYLLTIAYANGEETTAVEGLAYNGGEWAAISYPSTGAWANFSKVNEKVTLKRGSNIIRLAKGSPYFTKDTGYAEYDYIELSQIEE